MTREKIELNCHVSQKWDPNAERDLIEQSLYLQKSPTEIIREDTGNNTKSTTKR